MLPSDLIERLRDRAADPETRNDSAGLAGETSFFGGAFKTVRVPIDGAQATDPEAPAALASNAAIAAAEAELGFALPDELTQLYRDVADGGFGPGGGLAALADVVDRYRALTTEPPGEGGQTWPDDLVPIVPADPGAVCYDLATGKIIFWDEESLADGPGDRVWQGSFKPEADSLAVWLEDWLAKPPMADELNQQMEDVLLDGMRSTLAYWRAMTPEQRAEMGLPDEGWEEELFGHLGIDLSKL